MVDDALRAWIGRCFMRSTHDNSMQRQKTDGVLRADLVLLANTEQQYRTQIGPQLNHIGYDLIKVGAVAPLDNTTIPQSTRQSVTAQLQDPGNDRPMLVGTMDPVGSAASIEYANWSQIDMPNGPPLWALIDGVSWPEASALVAQTAEQSTCLYASADPQSQAIAPWLVKIDHGSEMAAIIQQRPHGTHSHILFHSTWSLSDLRQHFRKFTMVWTPANAEAPSYFRFYDPRVLADVTKALVPDSIEQLLLATTEVFLPSSPFVMIEEPLANDWTVDHASSFVRVASGAKERDPRRARSFRVSQPEFNRLTAFQQKRARLSLAHKLAPDYPGKKMPDIAAAVVHAHKTGQAYRMVSHKQINTLARCTLELGLQFPDAYPDAIQVLANGRTKPWRKRDLIDDWLEGQKSPKVHQ